MLPIIIPTARSRRRTASPPASDHLRMAPRARSGGGARPAAHAGGVGGSLRGMRGLVVAFVGARLAGHAALPVSGGWVDPDTHESARTTVGHEDGRAYELVFSDEFNVNGRNFKNGNDPKWTALNKNDYTNDALQVGGRAICRRATWRIRICAWRVTPTPNSE